MNLEYCRTIEFGNGTFQCFRNGMVNRMLKTGEWKQVGITPTDGSGKDYYVIGIVINGKQRQYKLHRLLAMVFLGLDIDDKTSVIDHLDGDGLNNEITNLRVCTARENQRNCKNVKGVSYIKRHNRFMTTITNDEGRMLHFTHKDHDTVLRWRQSKELELGYLTRATGIRT